MFYVIFTVQVSRRRAIIIIRYHIHVRRKVMSITLFVIPIKKGKVDDYKAFIKECLGQRRSEYKDSIFQSKNEPELGRDR